MNTRLSGGLEYSAIITTFNAEETIIACLNSVISQSVEPKEIIVVDDCSSDGTIEILKSYKKAYSKIKFIINKSNSGQSYSRNLAATISKSPILVFFDDDDVSLENRAKDHLRMHQLGYEVTFVSSRKNYSNGYNVQCKNEDFFMEKLDSSFLIRKLTLGKALKNDPVVWIPASTCSVKKDAFLQIGGFDLEMRRLEDAEFVIKASLYGLAAAWSSEILVERKATFSTHKGGEIEGRFERILMKKYSYLITDVDIKTSNLLIDFREAYFSKNFPRFVYLIFRNLSEFPFLVTKFGPFIRRIIHDGKRGGV